MMNEKGRKREREKNVWRDQKTGNQQGGVWEFES